MIPQHTLGAVHPPSHILRLERSGRALVAAVSLMLSVSTALAQVDWRAAQSPVKDQGRRGTCAAFAICGLLETFPGIPTDLSEQLPYATWQLHRNEVENWIGEIGGEVQLASPARLGADHLLDVYTPLLTFLGTCPESFLPCDPDPRQVAAGVPADLKQFLERAEVTPKDLAALRDGYGKYGISPHATKVYTGDELRDPETFKRLLGAGSHAVAVSYLVHAPSWANVASVGMTGTVEGRRYIHPGMMARFRRDEGEWLPYEEMLRVCEGAEVDFAHELRVGFIETQPLGGQEEYVGHAVLLVGYDDRGFLAKNSWGTGWGESGYCWITFDYHRLHAIQALQIQQASIRAPNVDPFERTARIRDGKFRVKVQKLALGRRPRFVLSTWMDEPRDCDYRFVEYTAERRDRDDAPWELVFTRHVQEGSSQSRNGAPFYFGAGAAVAFDRPGQVRLSIRIGTEGLKGADGREQPMWHRRVVFEPYDPATLTSCRDLHPAAK
ncbi:MAG: C1 family peptidase [bacterium]|nr:C1 family peptidase [bacterium]